MFMSDDLALSESLEADERRVVESSVVRVLGPRRVTDLVRRRRRILAGTREFDAVGSRRDRTTASALLTSIAETRDRCQTLLSLLLSGCSSGYFPAGGRRPAGYVTRVPVGAEA